MNTTHNRRREKRLSCHGNLSVVVKNSNKGFLGLFQKTGTATWMDFTHLGMAFQTDQRFDPGEQLLLDLLITDTSQVSLCNVVAVVQHATILPNNLYAYGVEFDFQANTEMQSTDMEQGLQNIAAMLEDIIARAPQ